MLVHIYRVTDVAEAWSKGRSCKSCRSGVPKSQIPKSLSHLRPVS